ncbi:VCBS domain-containing protein, partial [Hoeflea alexandrii]
REGENLVLTYVAQVDDGQGNVGAQNLVITITGTNDVPVIDATSVITGSVTESGDIADINEAGFGGSLSSDVVLTAGSQALLDGLQADGSGLEAALTAITTELGDSSQAIAVIWDYLDDNYVNGGPTQDPINEAFIRLGAAYAGLVKAGTISPLVDVTAKYTADNNANNIPQRVQSLHDNLLGNVTSAAIAQRFGGDALEGTLTGLVTGVDVNLLTRPYFSGNENASDAAARAFDIANGYVEAASGQLTATDVDNGETAQLLWSGNATGTYGTFSIDANTGEWVYKLDNSLASTQELAEGQIVTDSFVATVTDPHLATDTVTVTITITGSNDAPVIQANSVVAGAATEDADSAAPSTAIADFTAISGDIAALLAAPGYNDDMETLLQDVQGLPGVTSMADAITAVWQHLDANYGTYYGNTVNEAFVRLGLEYAEYIQGGGSPLIDVIAKFQADTNGNGIPQRLQSLHDNLLGNLDGPSLADKFLAAPNGSNNADPQPALHAELTQAIDDLGLTGRPIYGGYEGQANNALAFDQANGLLPAASGQLVATDVDTGETALLQWSGDATGTYGNFAIDTDTGVWTYFVNNGAAATQALAAGQTETETFTAIVTDPQGATDTIDVTITITGTNDAPVISANATREFVRGFDNANDTIDDSTGSGWGVVSLVASGTNGIATEDGSGYALISEAAGNGPFTRFDGYRSDWTGDWTAEVKVYLDTTWANGTGFDYTVAASGTDGSHQRDFIFHVLKASDGSLYVAGSNNTDFAANDGKILGIANKTEVTASGWYTLQHRFYEDGGVLKVDLNLVDGNGAVVWTETRTNAADTIPGEVGGNRYGWFTFVDVPGGLAVDGLGLNVDGTETRVAEFASGVGGLHTAGGEIPFTDVDLTDGHTVGAVAQAGGYVGVFNAQINAGDEATGGNTGVISWTFEVAETAIDSLAAGESLTQVYTVTVDDGNGGTDSQDVTITITGTNDAPVITDGPVAVTYAEAVDVAGATGQGVLTGGSLTGSLAFNDVDVTDTQTFRVVSATQTSGEIGGYTKPAFEAAALALMSVAGSVSSTGATTGGSINWAFTASDDFFDYLKTGETVEIEYVVEVSDGKGGTATQTITVTVNGANDVLFTDNGETVDLTVLTAADAQDGNYLDAMDGDDIVTLPDAGDALAGEYGPGKVFNAGNGSDVVNGGDMDDTINGGGGSDQIFGNGGNDDLRGGNNADELHGGTGNDMLSGGSGADRLYGDQDNDTLTGGNGDDLLDGGTGTDTAVYTQTVMPGMVAFVADADPATGGDQTGWTVATGGTEGSDGLIEIEIIQHAGGNILLVGNGGFDSLQAAVNAATAGDTIMIAAGTFAGDTTIDKAVTILGANWGTAGNGARGAESVLEGEITVTAATGTVVINGVEISNTSGPGAQFDGVTVDGGANVTVENSVFDATSTGGANGDRGIYLTVNATGEVSITQNAFGGAANGHYNTNWNPAIQSDGAGVDLAIDNNSFGPSLGSAIRLATYDEATGSISGNTFTKIAYGLQIDAITGGPVIASISGNEFNNVIGDINFGNVTSDITIDLSSLETNNFSSSGAMNITTGSGNDDVTGTSGVDTINGGAGSDALTGNGGADTLIGGTDDDTLKGDGGNDTLYGNATNLGVSSNVLAQVGENDVAVFDGVATDYNVTRAVDGSWRVEDIGAGETDSLYGIEGIDFGNDGVDLDLLANVFVFDGAGNLVGTFATIAAGIAAADAGYTVEVHEGIYAENLTVSEGITLKGVGNVTVDGAGSIALTVNGGGAGQMLSIDNIDFTGAGNQVILVNSSAVYDSVSLENGTVTGGKYNGLHVSNATGVAAISLDTVVFTGNATTESGGAGEGPVSFYQYNGDITLTGVTVENPGAAAENGIQFRGVNAPFQPMGTVTLDGVSVTGTYSKVGVAIYNFANANGLNIIGTGLTINVTADWFGLSIDGIDGDLDLSSLPLSVTNAIGTGPQDIGMQGLGGNNVFVGDDSDDLLIGGAGTDTLRGGAGNDYLVDGGGTTFDGGAGVDTVDLSALTGKVTVDLTSGAGGYAAHGATFTEIENIILNAADLSGGAASIVNGSSVDNVIVGSGRDDILSGREGNDTISGNDGNDIIDGGAGADVLSGGAGIDTLRLSVGGNASVIHTVNLTTNTVSGGELTGDTISGFENVTAAHNSTADFTGDGNANVLIGSNNDDILRGMGGDDTLIGDTGYNGGSNADILIGGSGNDALKGGGGSDTLYGNETDLGVASNVLAQSGESDTALYDGVAGDYNVTRETDGSWRVEDIAHGKVDALYGIEGIDFGSNGVDLDLTADVMVFDGSGNLIGTYATIQAAIDAGSTLDGYTVEIHAGTYAENLSVTKALSFVGVGAVSIDPASGTAVTLTGDLAGGNVSIDNIDLIGGTNGIFVETS